MTTASAVVSILMIASAVVSILMIASAIVTSVAVTSMTVTSMASASVASSSTSARMYELSVETFCKLFFSSLAYGKYLTCEMESLACHLMVEVHLYRIFSHFKYYTRDYCAHAVEHRDGVARYEKVFAHFSVYLEC